MKKLLLLLLVIPGLINFNLNSDNTSESGLGTAVGRAITGSLVPITNKSDAEYPIWVNIRSQNVVGDTIGGVRKRGYYHIGGAKRGLLGGTKYETYTIADTGNKIIIRTTIVKNGKPKEIEKTYIKPRGYVALEVTVNPNASSDTDVITIVAK